jgi:Tetratricopeptide repeat/Glycosyl hydrolase family 26
MRLTMLILAFVLTSGFLVAPAQIAARNADEWYTAGQAFYKLKDYEQAQNAFANAARLNPSAANWRWLGEARVKLEDYDGASAAFERAVGLYRNIKGQEITANALENLTNQYRQEGEFFLLDRTRPLDFKLAKLEPVSGILLGSYVDETGINRDGRINTMERVGTGFAVYFRYFNLIEPSNATFQKPFFPSRFAAAVKRTGAAMHLALEPKMPLARVTPSLVTAFATEAAKSGVPIYLRFAAEFNDPANEWSRDPKLYVQKFRLVHDIMARVAPNVAMVWMPMASRLEVIERYFPGDAYVDWVGLSLYSLPFVNGNTKISGERLNPLDAIKTFYAKYAARHPVQISEYASSHRTLAAANQKFDLFAQTKLRMLFWGAYLKYPRLKNINWLDLDMIDGKYVATSRQVERRNDYRLFVPGKREAYLELFFEPYFLPRYDLENPVKRSVPLPEVLKVYGALRIGAWVKTYAPYIAKVDFLLDGKAISSADHLPYTFELNTNDFKAGSHTLELRAFDSRGKKLLVRQKVFKLL